MYEIKPSNRFKRDLRLAKKRGYDLRLIEAVIEDLALGKYWTKNIETMYFQAITKDYVSAILHPIGF